MKSILIIGAAYPLRGGLAAFNERLAREFMAMGYQVRIYTFSLQYPSFLFPGKSQYSTDPPPDGLDIRVRINSMNPLNWIVCGREIRKESPDLVIVKFWLPIMGPCFGTILRMLGKNTRVLSILDNVIPHEKRFGDRAFTRYFFRRVDAFIAMSQQVLMDLRRFTATKPAGLVSHPLYDIYGEPLSRTEALGKLGLDPAYRYLLFFGFIRHYKGLDLLLEAMDDPQLSGLNIRLIVAGEFYEDPEIYEPRLKELEKKGLVYRATEFIPDGEVRNYFSAADVVVQPYRSATQSGISQIAYHFDKPTIVTNVGGLPELVVDGRTGLVCEARPAAIGEAISRFFRENERTPYAPAVREEKKKFTWAHLAEEILRLSGTA